jgi:hypothetical protein
MKTGLRRCAAVLIYAGLGAVAASQQPQPRPPDSPPAEVRLPNGKSQTDEILKAEHAANLKDAAELYRLADELRIDLEKNDRYVLSLATVKKTDEIEKLAKRIRSRLRR